MICSFRQCTFNATKDQHCLLHDAWQKEEEEFDKKLKNSFVEVHFANDQWRVKMADIVQYEGARRKAFALALKLSKVYKVGIAIFAPPSEMPFRQSGIDSSHGWLTARKTLL